MSMTRWIGLTALVGAFGLAPQLAEAQTRVGGSIGGEFDLHENWIVVSGEARIQQDGWPIMVQPRISFRPEEGGSVIQIDGNALVDFETTSPEGIKPVLGAGLGYHRQSFEVEGGDDFKESKLVVNLIAGVELELDGTPNLTPFAQTEYSFAKEFGNPFVLTFGALWTVSGG